MPLPRHHVQNAQREVVTRIVSIIMYISCTMSLRMRGPEDLYSTQVCNMKHVQPAVALYLPPCEGNLFNRCGRETAKLPQQTKTDKA